MGSPPLELVAASLSGRKICNDGFVQPSDVNSGSGSNTKLYDLGTLSLSGRGSSFIK